ncbi:Lrp/AsnC ligand binding domain-containing protein [Streptomyces sp. NPDC004393]|uniref:Lrp/AsnC ligand binding domain-containing protein n=1 Tax=Streptomyces sp. NPDC004533 TaxID=3154278 RepID=UPI0033A04700
MNRAHRANSRPLIGAGRAAPRATPTRPPPTQYVSQAICRASSRRAERSDSGREAQDAETVERFEQTLAQAPEVLELRRLFGSPDYFARVAVADLPAYETFLSRRVMTIPRIKNVTSHFTMKRIKAMS